MSSCLPPPTNLSNPNRVRKSKLYEPTAGIKGPLQSTTHPCHQSVWFKNHITGNLHCCISTAAPEWRIQGWQGLVGTVGWEASECAHPWALGWWTGFHQPSAHGDLLQQLLPPRAKWPWTWSEPEEPPMDNLLMRKASPNLLQVAKRKTTGTPTPISRISTLSSNQTGSFMTEGKSRIKLLASLPNLAQRFRKNFHRSNFCSSETAALFCLDPDLDG